MEHYFATVARGLEAIAAKELEELGAKDIQQEFTGVSFKGDRALLYRVNLESRLIFRVLVPIAEFKCRDARELYRQVRAINWEQYLQCDRTLAVRCTGSNPQLNHSYYTALQIKNAIVDRQRDLFQARSSVDPQNPDLSINAHIRGDRCILSLDSTGESLHRRGYRPAMGLAPLKETLAAALLEMAGWDASIPFLDPLCGSGTLPLEAGLKALKIAPGRLRDRFAFEEWSDFDPQLWKQTLVEAQKRELSELPAFIGGSDRDPEILQQARTNAENCALDRQVRFFQTDIADIEAPCDRGILICNPPYGQRLGETQELVSFYRLLGDIFKQRFKGWKAYVLTGSKELSKQVGLKASSRLPVYNGAIACTLLEYELY
ncbi:THUMP domain-containing protein [Oscillatoria sp. FACHB-1406]|uniref:THUMP domain-containing class I SAM-dependent RNA methyltransferase n=1 Tax=Oscillatoria sp. FACHB-1406 TaxID=2692846 RepID=UPI001687B8E3|nr:THUMP domain-containing protein [Oscillatoria sp. FACHB-1406]MBD2580519.1 RNA methyltransferase [Oscillatoria sp. FACHB-1406]